MGACQFANLGLGSTAQEAFDDLVSQAKHTYGHGGYTGTIAEKDSFRMVFRNTADLARPACDVVNELMDSSEGKFYEDKWGPAGCIAGDEPRQYIFFGWTSE